MPSFPQSATAGHLVRPLPPPERLSPSERATGRRLPRLCALLLCVVLLRAAPLQAEEGLPFAPGEKLTFNLKWLVFPAGQAVLEILPLTQIDGTRALHYVLHARSNAFVDAFYKVRQRIDAFTDLRVTRSLLYRKKQIEGSARRDVAVTFDWSQGTAQYASFGQKEAPVAVVPGTFDPLSILYYARRCTFQADDEISGPVTDGKKTVIGKARVVKRETITVDGRTYDTLLLEPELKHIGGVFEKSPNAGIKLWVTADRRRLPVKIQSKVAVGSFTGELVSVSGRPES